LKPLLAESDFISLHFRLFRKTARLFKFAEYLPDEADPAFFYKTSRGLVKRSAAGGSVAALDAKKSPAPL